MLVTNEHGDRPPGARHPQSRLGARPAARHAARPASADDEFFEAYRFILPGYNVRPLEMCGAIGLEQLKKLDGMLETRRANAALFVSCSRGDDRFILQREHGRSSWFSFTIILNPALRHRSRHASWSAHARRRTSASA